MTAPAAFAMTRRAAAVVSLAATACLAGGLALPLQAATPKDTLVVALAFDDIITLDPAEAFEISAGEIMGNAYDRLLRYDVADPSKLIGDLAKTWTVSADGKTFSFELQPGLKFASGNPMTADDVAWSLQRAVLLDKTPAFILTQFGFTKDNVKAHQADRPADADADHREGLRADLRAELPDCQRGRGGRQEAALAKETKGDLGYGLAEDQLRRHPGR
jgi:peptide/nickel transport system substrate-binding protein